MQNKAAGPYPGKMILLLYSVFCTDKIPLAIYPHRVYNDSERRE